MKNDFKIAREVAESDFEKMCNFFDVDLDDPVFDDDREAFTKQREKVLKAICDGRLTVSDDGQPTYQPKRGGPMTFKEPDGALLLVQKKNADDDTRRAYSMIIEATGGGSSPNKWSMKDVSALLAVFGVFMKELQ